MSWIKSFSKHFYWNDNEREKYVRWVYSMNVCSARHWECVIWTGEAYTAVQTNCQHRCPVPGGLLWLGVGGLYIWWVLGCSGLELGGAGGVGFGNFSKPSEIMTRRNLHSVLWNLNVTKKEKRETVYPKHFENSTQRSNWKLLAWFSWLFWSGLGCLSVCWGAFWLLVIAANSWSQIPLQHISWLMMTLYPQCWMTLPQADNTPVEY